MFLWCWTKYIVEGNIGLKLDDATFLFRVSGESLQLQRDYKFWSKQRDGRRWNSGFLRLPLLFYDSVHIYRWYWCQGLIWQCNVEYSIPLCGNVCIFVSLRKKSFCPIPLSTIFVLDMGGKCLMLNSRNLCYIVFLWNNFVYFLDLLSVK